LNSSQEAIKKGALQAMDRLQTSPIAMPQLSKLIRSRDDWKKKAVSRADAIREYRKTEKRHRNTIAELRGQLEEFKQADGDCEKKRHRRL
jgi:hypothetical protein